MGSTICCDKYSPISRIERIFQPTHLRHPGVLVGVIADRPPNHEYTAPLASRGIVGQVTPSTIVYDAETTLGGSGGPVPDIDGDVVAVNAAILPEYGGSNLGIPVAELRALLREAMAN